MIILPTNRYQTPVTDELLASLSSEEREEFLNYLTNVPFIRNLISTARKYAKDLERDSKGRIIVDVCNPHILEDMDYFRQAALHYKEHGVYTHLRPSSNPNSPFGKWFATELDRIWNGMVRESDGEWIPGNMYFYLNYMPISLTVISEGTMAGERIDDFPEMWEGVYLWYHYIDQARFGGKYDSRGGRHAAIIARRGASKSYTSAAILAKNFICGISKKQHKSIKSLAVAFSEEYLTKDGLLNKFENALDFLAETTQFPSRRSISSLNSMSWKMGYKDIEKNITGGTKNTVNGVAISTSPGKARGKRSSVVIYEEFGAFPNFITTYNTNLPNVEEGSFAFGQNILQGTGGAKSSDFSGALEVIYSPVAFNIYSIPNVFDKESQGKKNSIFFFGGYLNRKGFYDKNGISDVVGACLEEVKFRHTLKESSNEPTILSQRVAEYAMTIQESLLKTDGAYYPVADLNDRYLELLSSEDLKKLWTGRLSLNDEVVSYYPSDDTYIVEFPHKNNKMKGAIAIAEMPVRDAEPGRYIAGIDTFDDDGSDTLSLGSIFIMDLWTDRLVFEYTGRDLLADSFYEICRRALLFYKAEANYENNKKGLFKYFSQYNCLYLLTDTLEFLKDSSSMRESVGNKQKGTFSSAPVKAYGRRVIKDWLLKPVPGGITRDENGKEIQPMIPNLQRIPFPALLKELALWNPDGNFDRHDALAMLLLLREDRVRLYGENIKDSQKQEKEDAFFSRYEKKKRRYQS